MPKVLVVEHESSLAEALTVALVKEGFAVDVAVDGVEAIERFEAVRPDAVLLDLILPKLSGIEVCRRLRVNSQLPIIILSARDAEMDVVVGLEAGADDYICKPFRVRELVARLRAVLRRAHLSPGERVERNSVLEVGNVRLDVSRHELTVSGRPVHLPLKEFELLKVLMVGAGRVAPRGRLIEAVWGPDYRRDTKTLEVHVKRLRAKIEDDPSRPVHIATIRGLGYRFEIDRSEASSQSSARAVTWS